MAEVTNNKAGHIIRDGDNLMFTSIESAGGFISHLLKLVDSMAGDLSKITGIPSDRIVSDYVEENELSLMAAAFRSVLRKRGCSLTTTATREAIDNIIRKQNDRAKQEAPLKPEECVPDKPFGKFKCESTWDKISHRYVYKITYPGCANGPAFQITSDSDERDDYDTLCQKIRRREVEEYLARR